MWKSQYVPYDGIPFVNAGSRAIVMECQFGPRRKGIQTKKGSEQESNQNPLYKTTCPARIYIKKVRKFLEYKVSTDPKVDKKIVRQEQEKAFFNLKKSSWDDGGVVRYYIQLPTENAHTYHDVDTADLPDLLEICIKEEEEEDSEDLANEAVQDGFAEDGASLPSRLHPLVAEKICDLVAQGHDQVYAVRKQLRRFVEREMFKTEGVPERHNLCYFPTVNDIKNHIHEAQKALQLKSESDTEWKAEDNQLIPETLSPATVDASSQKEELLEESETLSPEAVHLFSSLNSIQPKIFAHLQSINLQHVGLCPEEDSKQALSSAPEARELSPVSVLLGPSVLLQSNVSAGEGASESNTDSELVSVSPHTDPAAEGGITQILQGEPVPVQIVELSGIAPTPSENAAQNGALGDHPPGSVQ
ncbi:hypothetical protein DNTS_000103 [Danionella cerebrum]|nr:hypothetical protein DNTS_000103 [Danionella translucida]